MTFLGFYILPLFFPWRGVPAIVEGLAAVGMVFLGAGCVYGAFAFRRHPVRVRRDGVLRCLQCRYPVERTFDRCPECGSRLDEQGLVLGYPYGVHGSRGPAVHGDKTTAFFLFFTIALFVTATYLMLRT